MYSFIILFFCFLYLGKFLYRLFKLFWSWWLSPSIFQLLSHETNFILITLEEELGTLLFIIINTLLNSLKLAHSIRVDQPTHPHLSLISLLRFLLAYNTISSSGGVLCCFLRNLPWFVSDHLSGTVINLNIILKTLGVIIDNRD